MSNPIPLRHRSFPSYLLRLPALARDVYRISRRTSGRRQSIACAWWSCVVGVRTHRRVFGRR